MTFSSARLATGHFTQIANKALRDPRLSYRAKGILAAALTHDPGFEFGRAWLDSHGTEGRDSITIALNELKEFGYCRVVYLQGPDGKRQGATFAFTDAGDLANHQTTENQATENQATENQSTGLPPYKNTNRRTPEEEDQIEPPTVPPLALEAMPDLASRGRKTAESIPVEFAEYTDLINYWLERRKLKGGRLPVWHPRGKSAPALRRAVAAGIAKEYLEAAAEGGWTSLGHAGSNEVIERLTAASAGSPGPSRFRSPFQPPEPLPLQPYVRGSY